MLYENKELYHVHHGDCIKHMPLMPAASVDFSVFSPPFPALYAYTSSPADIGNSENLDHEAKLHLSFFYRQLARVLKPGRVAVVHVMQIPRMKRSGEVGLFDFRGLNIRVGQRAGLIYEYDWSVRKNPQAQAIRTKSRELQFAGLESDRAKSRGSLPDYLIKFRAAGDNAVPVVGQDQVSRNDWIEWAECCWTDIRETDTLNVAAGKGENDTKHICPLQLTVIRRLIKLYSNPGEIVFSPFAGIGSEGYEAVRLGRKFYGCELKDEYHAEALRNLARAEKENVDAINDSLFANAGRGNRRQRNRVVDIEAIPGLIE
jgi:DNA modification methylase